MRKEGENCWQCLLALEIADQAEARPDAFEAAVPVYLQFLYTANISAFYQNQNQTTPNKAKGLHPLSTHRGGRDKLPFSPS